MSYVTKFLFGNPNWRHELFSDNWPSLDNLSLFATANMHVGSTRVNQALPSYNRHLTVDFSPAVISLGATTRKPNIDHGVVE